MSTDQATSVESAVRKVFRHLLWFLVLLYVMSYLDRINIGFAALTMNRDLGLNATRFGLANTFFYITYAVFEVPSNIMLMRFGARKWLSRIMITWGVAACATLFATGPYSLYGLRALVGLAEAGALPGVLLYLGLWFPKPWRAKANSFFLMSMPIAMIIGSPLSGWILQFEGWLGLAGWKWLFLLEGLPSIVFGIVAYFYLPDRPATARWLTSAEKVALQQCLDEERLAVPALPADQQWVAIWREIRTKKVLCLATAWFCMVATINTLGTWSPQIVRELLGGTDRLLLVGFVATIPPLFTIITMPIFSTMSDRRNERLWHTIALVGVAAVGWVTVVMSSQPIVQMVGLTLASIGIFGAYGIFWALAMPMLSKGTQPVGIAVITTSGILASILSPSIVGVLRDLTVSFKAGLWYSAALLAIGMVFIFVATQSARSDVAAASP